MNNPLTISKQKLNQALNIYMSDIDIDDEYFLFKDFTIHNFEKGEIVCDIHIWMDYDMTTICYLRFTDVDNELVLVDITDDKEEVYFRMG